MNNSAIPLRRLFVSSLAMAVAVGCAPTIQQPHSTVLGALDPLNRQGTVGLAVAGGEIEPTYWRLETNRGQAAKDGFADTVGDGAGTGAAPGLFISAICLPCAIIGLPLALGGAVVGSLVGGAAGAAEGSANAATQSSSMPISQLAGADQLRYKTSRLRNTCERRCIL